jgi:hypothetical protein
VLQNNSICSDQKPNNINFEVRIYERKLAKKDSVLFITIVLTILVISSKAVLIAEAESFTPIPTAARSLLL